MGLACFSLQRLQTMFPRQSPEFTEQSSRSHAKSGLPSITACIECPISLPAQFALSARLGRHQVCACHCLQQSVASVCLRHHPSEPPERIDCRVVRQQRFVVFVHQPVCVRSASTCGCAHGVTEWGSTDRLPACTVLSPMQQ